MSVFQILSSTPSSQTSWINMLLWWPFLTFHNTFILTVNCCYLYAQPRNVKSTYSVHLLSQ
jgi:hypothetical protein